MRASRPTNVSDENGPRYWVGIGVTLYLEQRSSLTARLTELVVKDLQPLNLGSCFMTCDVCMAESDSRTGRNWVLIYVYICRDSLATEKP